MRIGEIKLREESTFVRAEAQVVWDNANRTPLLVYVSTPQKFGEGFRADANGFFIAALLAAWHSGEERLQIDGELCPLLLSNINAALMTLRSWYPELGAPPVVEATSLKSELPVAAGALSFLSCGIDSLATLRANRTQLPAEHPAAIKSVLMVEFDGASFMTEQERSNTK